MTRLSHLSHLSLRAGMLAAALAGMAAMASPVQAKLPAPTPEQAQAAAAKKAQDAAQTEKAKQELAASMESIATRWRSHASANGWEVYPQASAGAGSAPAPSAAPPPSIRSEKLGTAPPSEDVKDPAKKGK